MGSPALVAPHSSGRMAADACFNKCACHLISRGDGRSSSRYLSAMWQRFFFNFLHLLGEFAPSEILPLFFLLSSASNTDADWRHL